MYFLTFFYLNNLTKTIKSIVDQISDYIFFMIEVTLICTGRLSFNLMNEILNNKRFKLNQVFGRAKFRPKHISDDVDYIKEIKNINKSDFYLIAVSDNEIYNVSNQFDAKEGIVLHVSGNTNINVLSNHKNYGVFYPLQTFSYETNFKQLEKYQ